MNVNFVLDVDDWVAFQEYYRKRSAPLYRIMPYLLIASGIVLVVLNAVYFFLYKEATLWNGISLIFLAVIFYGLYLKKKADGQMRKIAIELKEKNPDVFGLREMTFTEEGMEIKTEKANKYLTWEEMERYEENNDYYFLYSGKGVVYIVPKNRIDVTPDEFGEMLNNYLK